MKYGAQEENSLEWERHQRSVIMFISDYVRIMRRVGIVGPIRLGLTLMQLKHVYLVYNTFDMIEELRPMRHNQIVAPAVDLPANMSGEGRMEIAKAMRPMLDYIWRSTGAKRCPNYDRDGNFTLGALR